MALSLFALGTFILLDRFVDVVSVGAGGFGNPALARRLCFLRLDYGSLAEGLRRHLVYLRDIAHFQAFVFIRSLRS